MRDGPRRFRQDSSCPALLRWPLRHITVACKGLSPASVALSKTFQFPNMTSLRLLQPRHVRKHIGLGSAPFARHYSGYRLFFLFLRVLRCFSSPGSPRDLVAVPGSLLAGFPIRTSAGHRAFAPHRGFSQLITSFFASESHRHPPCALVHFLCCFSPGHAPKGAALTFAYIRLARFFRFSQSNRFDFLVLRSHHVNDLF